MPTSVSRLMVAPPTAPPTLTSAGGGRTYSVPSPPPPVQRGDHELHMSTTTTPSERNSHSPDSPTQSELPSVSVREKSISRDETHSSSEDDENDRQPSFEGSPTPLVAGSRSGSLTDVSTCSEASSTKTSLSQGKPTVVPETNVDRQSPSQHESEQRCSDFDSASEHSSIGKNHQSLEEEEKDTSTNWKNQPPSSEDLFPPPGTTLSYPLSHHSTAMTTLATHPAPLVTITTATTAATPFLTHPSPNSLHDSTLHQQTVHLHTHEPNQPSEYECSEDTSTGVSKQPPPPAAVKLPNFFMTPEQLEESMRTLRAGALSRAPPKTCSDQPPSATHAQHVQCHRDSVATHLKTLQEVRAYLESRRTAERPPNREITTAETQRLARILSS